MGRSARAVNTSGSYIAIAAPAGIANAAYGLSAAVPEIANRRRSCDPAIAPMTSIAASELALFSIVQPRGGPPLYSVVDVRGGDRSGCGGGAPGARLSQNWIDIRHRDTRGCRRARHTSATRR